MGETCKCTKEKIHVLDLIFKTLITKITIHKEKRQFTRKIFEKYTAKEKTWHIQRVSINRKEKDKWPREKWKRGMNLPLEEEI